MPTLVDRDEQDVMHAPEHRKRKAEDALLLSGHRKHSAPGRHSASERPRTSVVADHGSHATTMESSAKHAQTSGEDFELFKRDHSVAALIELLADSSAGLHALTTHVAIFGVLQHAQASATTGDEFGVEYVRGFISLLSQRTSDRAWITKITNLLKGRLQESCNRVRLQISSLHAATQPVNPHAATHLTQPTHKVKHKAQIPAHQTAKDQTVKSHSATHLSQPTHKVTPRAPQISNHQAARDQQRKYSAKNENLTATQQGTQQQKTSTPRPAERSGAPGPSEQSKQSENQPAHSTAHHASSRQQFGRTQRQDQRFNSFLASIADFGRAPDPASNDERPVAEATVSSFTRPEHHLYKSTSADAQDEVIASIRADIRNYTEPGEDLDWTKLTDKAERRRLQGIVGGRKYRERMLAASGKGGSGGNYPGASGEGSSISKGYGKRTGLDATQSRSSQPSSANGSLAKSRTSLASATTAVDTSARGQSYTRPEPISISSSDEPDSDEKPHIRPSSNGQTQLLHSDEQPSRATDIRNRATVKVQAKSIAERYMEKVQAQKAQNIAQGAGQESRP